MQLGRWVLTGALFWSGAQTGVRMLLGFLTIKVTAVYLGPVGLALVGQAGNFLTLLHDHVSSAVGTAATRMVVEGRDTGRNEAPVWATALRFVALMGAALGVVLTVVQWPVATWLFGDSGYSLVLVLIGAVLPLAMMYQVGTGVLSARMDFRALAYAQIGATVIGAAVFVSLSYAYGIPGGLAGAVLSNAAGVFILVGILRWRGYVPLNELRRSWEGQLVRPLLALYPMLLANSIATPLTQLLVRDALIARLSPNDAGIWQATLRISEMSTAVLLSALSMYTLPALSALKGRQRSQAALGLSVKAGALAALVALLVYLVRDWVVHLLLTVRFAQVSDLLGAQVLGDVFKLAGWPMRAALSVQQRTRAYIGVEVGMAAGQIALTHAFVPRWGIHAGPYAYVVVGAVTLVALLWLHRSAFMSERSSPAASA